MPVFCITADYTPAALTEMRNNPTDRRQAAEQFAEAAGGKVLAWYGTMTNGPGVPACFMAGELSPMAERFSSSHRVKAERLSRK
jgi:hypothetical protein